MYSLSWMKFMHALWYALSSVMPFRKGVLEISAPWLCLKGCLFCEQTFPPLLAQYSTLIVLHTFLPTRTTLLARNATQRENSTSHPLKFIHNWVNNILPSDGVAVGSLWGHSLEVPARHTKHNTQVLGTGKKDHFRHVAVYQ